MNTYEALKQRTEARRKAMTPAQKRREFIRCQFAAKQCAKTTLFVNVFGLSEPVKQSSINTALSRAHYD